MSGENLFAFLRTVAARVDLLDSLKVQSKDEVIAAAADLGLPFTAAEFDDLVWALEARLAERRGEAFDAQFPLWQTLWGQFYLEYVVRDVMTSFDDSDFAAVLAERPRAT
ncbi:MAG: Nif11 family protein [Allosphingosinicella sp.]|jgi:predicted kinase|nr:Nif11 family protein [Rhodoplanes sp.]